MTMAFEDVKEEENYKWGWISGYTIGAAALVGVAVTVVVHLVASSLVTDEEEKK